MNTVRLAPQLKEKIQRVANGKGISVSELHREALEMYCANEVHEEKSRYDDVIGIIEAPADLSTNYKEMYTQAMVEKHGNKG